jgi:hypothetical protein
MRSEDFTLCIACVVDNIYTTYKELVQIHKCVGKTFRRFVNSIRGCMIACTPKRIK